MIKYIFVFVSLVFTSGFITAKEKVFTKITNAKLNDKQSQIIDSDKKLPGVESIIIVDLDVSAFNDKNLELKIQLEEKLTITIKDYNLKTTENSVNMNWKGQSPKDYLNISLTGKSVVGLIYSNDKLYFLEPIGGGLHAIFRIDQSKLPKERK